MVDSSTTELGGGRIPASLQAVFLASNRGKEVNKPPPRQVAFKVFSNMLNMKRQRYENQAKKNIPARQQTPQEFLDNALVLRGYSTQCYTTSNSGYSNAPTPLQLASYDVHILKMAIRDKNVHAMLDILTCGISPNACNKFGESLLYRVCKSGEDKLLQVFLDCGADIQVSDSEGRTPLHAACQRSRPSFKTFELILQKDPRLIHMLDGSGALPLSYVRKDQYGAWIEYLGTMLDTYWKPLDESSGMEGPPPLALEKGNSRPVLDPENALPLELAALVACGRMKPDEAIAEHQPEDDDSTWDDEDDSEDDSDFYDDDTNTNTDFDFDEKEFEELQGLAKAYSSTPTAVR
jgi:hypothetical protein